MLRGVIYARYSSEKQNDQSIEGQLRENRAYAEKNGIEIVGTYIDRALSAKTDARPEFQRMIKDSSKHSFDVVIVWKLDRFARNRYDSAKYKAVLKNNVKVVSATELISEGTEGIILESVLEGIAEYYSAELAEKVKRGMTETALKCKYNGGSLPIGFVIDKQRNYQIDPFTSPLVLQAFTDYANGFSMRQIVDNLNLAGLRTCNGGKITLNCATTMLNNRKYLGEYRFSDIVVPDGIPRIVPDELFDRVQKKLAHTKKNRSKYKAEEEYLLTTKLFCGKCRCFMVGESGTSKTGDVHRYYKCASVKQHKGCDKKSVRKHLIEDLDVEQIKKVLMDDELLEKLAETVIKAQEKENVVLPALNAQLADLQRKIDNVMNAIERGIITDSTKERLEALEKEKKDLQRQIAVEENDQPPLLTKEQILFWFEKMRQLDTGKLDHKRRLIDAFINAIYLYDDKAVFVFNYKDGSKTVTFEEIEGAGLGSDSIDGSPPEKDYCLDKDSSPLFLSGLSMICPEKQFFGRNYMLYEFIEQKHYL